MESFITVYECLLSHNFVRGYKLVQTAIGLHREGVPQHHLIVQLYYIIRNLDARAFAPYVIGRLDTIKFGSGLERELIKCKNMLLKSFVTISSDSSDDEDIPDERVPFRAASTSPFFVPPS